MIGSIKRAGGSTCIGITQVEYLTTPTRYQQRLPSITPRAAGHLPVADDRAYLIRRVKVHAGYFMQPSGISTHARVALGPTIGEIEMGHSDTSSRILQR